MDEFEIYGLLKDTLTDGQIEDVCLRGRVDRSVIGGGSRAERASGIARWAKQDPRRWQRLVEAVRHQLEPGEDPIPWSPLHPDPVAAHPTEARPAPSSAGRTGLPVQSWDLFLAHAAPDKAHARRLHALLKDRCRVFLDESSVELGDSWDIAIRDAQRASLISVVMVSSHTDAAWYAREEIAAAIDLARSDADSHRVVPLYLDGLPSRGDAVPYGLRLKHGMALDEDTTMALAAQRLLDLVRRLRPQDAPGAPSRRQCGRWTLGLELGRGGYGAVYEATDREGLQAAVKLLHDSTGTSPEDLQRRRARMDRGAAALSKLVGHPGVVELLEGPEHGPDGSWYAMQLVRGQNLRRLGRNRLLQHPLSLRLGWFRQVCEAVQHAHERSDGAIFHRDLTPENILLETSEDPWRAVVCDFDLSRDETEQSLTRTVGLVGKMLYIPPEQVGSWGGGAVYEWERPPEIMRDLWALGMLLHLLLTGTDNNARAMRRKQRSQAFGASGTDKETAEGLNALVEWMLADEPEERPLDVGEILARLDSVGAMTTPVSDSQAPLVAPEEVGVSPPVDRPNPITPAPIGRSAPELGEGGWSPDSPPLLRPEDLAGFRPRRRTLPELGMSLVWVPPGEFWMGATKERGHPAFDPQARDSECSPRRVRFTRGFWLGEHPVTNAEWQRFCEADRRDPPPTWREERFVGDDLPVTGVSWEDATAFCAWLSNGFQMRLQARLPTEAEWEWAARGPEGRRYPWGSEDPSEARAVLGLPYDKGAPRPVGGRTDGVGPFGAQDQAGNVWEWVQDTWRDTYLANAGVDVDPCHEDDNVKVGVSRVIRGGSWAYSPSYLRCACRDRRHPRLGYNDLGFRLCVSVPPSAV